MNEPSAFCVTKLLIIDSISLMDIDLFRLFISSCVSFGNLHLQEIHLFTLGCKICGHRIVHGIPLFSF